MSNRFRVPPAFVSSTVTELVQENIPVDFVRLWTKGLQFIPCLKKELIECFSQGFCKEEYF